jgi:hypothetical protein
MSAFADPPRNQPSRLERSRAKELVDTPSPLAGKEEHRVEYIHQMIALAADDVRHVTLYTTFSLGITGLLVSQLPLERVLGLPIGFRILLCVGLVLLAAAALAYFGYVRELHKTRMRMTRCLPTVDAERVRELWAGEFGVWQTQGWRYKIGRILLAVGLVVVGTVLSAVYIHAPAAVR